jgi:uncharacterized protein involved in exopolysaccharide biosynthesis
MNDFTTFEPAEFALWCGARWRFCALAVAVATVVTLAVSVVQPRQFTATATILIGAPAGNDPRAATAMNAVYLDSLKAWERVAASDYIFLRSLEKTRAGGTEPSGTMAGLKRKILRVAKPGGMALLEIAITLPSARQAQLMAQTMAEYTVAQSHAEDDKTGVDLNSEARAQREAATLRVANAEKARETLSAVVRLDALKSDLQAAGDLNGRLQTEIALARAEAEGYRAQADTVRAGGAGARIASLDRQQKEAAEQVAVRSARLQAGRNRWNDVEAELEAARRGLEAASRRLDDAVSAARYRGERLRLVDPGAVPQEPSSPDILLNLAGALIVSTGVSLLWLTLTYGVRRRVTGRQADPVYSLR